MFFQSSGTAWNITDETHKIPGCRSEWGSRVWFVDGESWSFPQVIQVYGPQESAIPFSQADLNTLPFLSRSSAGQTALQQAPPGGGKQHLINAVISANVPTANPAEE